MFGQIEEMQKQLQVKLAALTIDGEAGDGKIKIQVNGNQELLNIEIDPSLMTGDAEELEDLLLVGINRTMEKAAAQAGEATKSMMSGLLPPGMDMPGL